MPTPAEPGQPQERKVVEPIRVLRPRNTDALADLFREMTELTKEPVSYESIPMQGLPDGTDEPATERLPPVGHWTDAVPAADAHDPAGPATEPVAGQDWAEERSPSEPAADRGAAAPAGWGEHPSAAASAGPAERPSYGSRPTRPAGRPYGPPRGRTGAHPAAPAARGARGRRDAEGPGNGLRRAAIAVGVCAAALVGFAGALLVPGRGGEAAAETVRPQPSATQPDTSSPSADPDGAGTLREGDSGPEVTDLQQRLLKIPDVYRDGPTDGRYDATLTEAVARFQLWYGIRGDEDGVYGDDTRQALESRTGG
ncbi:peptidoglycan-binding domain-containing protein [Streptomyces sp. SS7]|uniref:peptidoglycan-binding domain-containing protein n=1 Tax=Streptomyces sp. SS7 TaxID=3108485 RepID=UPI0030EB39C1